MNKTREVELRGTIREVEVYTDLNLDEARGEYIVLGLGGRIIIGDYPFRKLLLNEEELLNYFPEKKKVSIDNERGRVLFSDGTNFQTADAGIVTYEDRKGENVWVLYVGKKPELIIVSTDHLSEKINAIIYFEDGSKCDIINAMVKNNGPWGHIRAVNQKNNTLICRE